VFQSHLQPTSQPREPYTKIHKHDFDHGIMAMWYLDFFVHVLNSKLGIM